MLEYLRIRQLALIEDMELEFAPGMNVLTGETGAGKSFILKALGFLLGDRLSTDMVRNGSERATVEALFTLTGKDLVLRRELSTASGRSRLYINDELRSQESLRDLRAKLVAHTSQHAQHRLLHPAFQARLLEHGMDCQDLLRQRAALLERLNANAAKHAALRDRQSGLAERRELLEMQRQEIDRIRPEEGEEERLEALRAQARSADRLRQGYAQAFSLLQGGEQQEGLLDQLAHLEKLLRHMEGGDDSLAEKAEAAAVFRRQMQDLSACLRHPPALSALADAPDMDRLEARLFALAQLKRKLRRSIPEILLLRQDIEEDLSFLDRCALDFAQLSKEAADLIKQLTRNVAAMEPLRREAADTNARILEKELRQLGFSETVQVIPDFTPQEIWPGVMEKRGGILWAPNPGQPAQPLDRIASGGELSRFLLALTGLLQDDAPPTLIFDEVDAGVGGITLNKLAEKLSALAESRQLLLITHWPQLAVRAQRHFQISKIVRDGATYTLCVQLDRNSRHAELVRMGGGGAQGEALAKGLEDLGNKEKPKKRHPVASQPNNDGPLSGRP